MMSVLAMVVWDDRSKPLPLATTIVTRGRCSFEQTEKGDKSVCNGSGVGEHWWWLDISKRTDHVLNMSSDADVLNIVVLLRSLVKQ